MSIAHMPMRRRDFASTDRDETVEFIRREYIDHRPRFHRNADGGRFSARLVEDNGILTADASNVTLGFGVETAPFSTIMARTLHQGQIRVGDGAEELRLTAGAIYLYRPGRGYRVDWRQVKTSGLALSQQLLEEVASSGFDLDPAELRFEAGTPVTPELGAYWARVSGFVVRELLTADSVVTQPLISAQVHRFVADAMLTVFPNTTMTAHYEPGPGRVAPAAIRRAVAYLEENADRPIRLDEIAAAAGTRPRAVQYAFRRYFNTTPLGYLKTLRLRRAHLELQAGDPARGDSVAAIARRWGYASPNSFTSAYRRVYGVTPLQTLRT
ncbi:helix-turn-helix transcriptional regulator [Tomitella gaofuii]|uniref:helix-turn-helix transcriptional regulator n=1 Tax=Tomitella gaofuii TaxID=2760083 RepID=UPI0015FB3E1C|nr:AraC family transcriptional regulator [Tomitella gaofuii]